MSTLSKIGVILICLLFVGIPWPIGGNLLFARTLVGIVAATVLLLAVMQQLVNTFPQRFSLTWLAVAIGVGFAAFQICPLSNSLTQLEIGQRGAQSSSVAGLAADDARQKVFQPSPFGVISYQPAASRERLAELSFAVGIFFATCCLAVTRFGVYAIMLTASIAGISVTFFGIVQKLVWTNKIFWIYEYSVGGSPFASFVNRNNAGGFLLACLCGAIFFIAYQYFKWNPREHLANKDNLIRDWEERQDAKSRKFYMRFLEYFAALEPRHLYSYATLILICVGISVSLSRGALLAMCVTLLAGVIMLAIVNRWVVIGFGMLTIVAAGLMVWLDQSESVIGRIETLSDIQTAAGPRFQHWQEIIPYINEHWLWGSGLGTYEYLQFPFQQSFFEASFTRAENVYLETIAELGVIGLSTLIVFLTTCFILSVRLFRRDYAFDRAVGVAGVCCIVGQSVASLFDFGIYMPANAVAVATILGTVVARATSLPQTADPYFRLADVKENPWLPRLGRVVILIGVTVLCLIGIYESVGVESLRLAKRQLSTYNKGLGADVELLDHVFHSLERAKSIRPDDNEVEFQLGEYEVARYREKNTRDIIQLAAQVAEEELSQRIAIDQNNVEVPTSVSILPNESGKTNNSGSTGAPSDLTQETLTREQIWYSTSLTSRHRIFRFAERNNPEMLKKLRNNEHHHHLETAWQHYLAADQWCNYPPKHKFRLAQLSAFFDVGNEKLHLTEALNRSEPSSELLFEAGLVALHSGDQETAVDLWNRCLSHTMRFEEPIVRSSQFELPMKVFFEKVLPQDPEYLLRISQKYFDGGQRTLPNDLLLFHTKRVLKTAEISEIQRLKMSGEVEKRLQNYSAAAEFYRLAIGFDEQDVPARLNYAICLQKTKQFDEAVKHLKILELTSGSHLQTVKSMLKQIRKQRLQLRTPPNQ